MAEIGWAERIAWVAVATGGAIGIAPCPGPALEGDLAALGAAGASVLVTLMEGRELVREGLSAAAIAEACATAGLAWRHLPIADFDAPGTAFENAWETVGPGLGTVLAAGGRVCLHCRAGRGRSGLVAARLLIARGLAPAAAIARVRARRPGAIETAAQERWLRTILPGA